MFWKKNPAKPDLIQYETKDARGSYRISSTEVPPVSFNFKKKAALLIDISAGGLSFLCPGCQAGETDFIVIDLKSKSYQLHLACEIEIIACDEPDVCRCRYLNIDEEMIEEIHQYVLAKQKELIRENKGKGGKV